MPPPTSGASFELSPLSSVLGARSNFIPVDLHSFNFLLMTVCHRVSLGRSTFLFPSGVQHIALFGVSKSSMRNTWRIHLYLLILISSVMFFLHPVICFCSHSGYGQYGLLINFLHKKLAFCTLSECLFFVYEMFVFISSLMSVIR